VVKGLRRWNFVRKSHQRSWWIIHTRPTEGGVRFVPVVPPTQLGFGESRRVALVGQV